MNRKITQALVLLVAALGLPAAALAAPCSGYQPLAAGKEFSFTRYEAAARRHGAEDLPMTSRLLYRGILEKNVTYDLASVLRGILLSPQDYIGSPMFWQIQELLRGKIALDDDLFGVKGYHRVESYLKDRRVLDDARALLECAAEKPFTPAEVDRYAADLMNKFFFARKDEVQSLYFDLGDSRYYGADWKGRGFGNNAFDLVIGTPYDQIASLYGKKTLIFADGGRGIDLGNWNLGKGNRYQDSWVDNGEINVPGYIQGKDFRGYQLRETERTRQTFGVEPNNPIDWSFHKAKVAGVDVVLVLDGSKQRCVIEGDGGRYYGCVLPDAHSVDVPALPKLPKGQTYAKRIPLVGAILACAKAECPVAKPRLDAFFSAYGKAGRRELPAGMLAEIQSVAKGAKSLRFFANRTVDDVPGIQVVSATFGGDLPVDLTDNAKAAVAKYCDGKAKCDYLVSKTYLGGVFDGVAKTFDVAYSCGAKGAVVKKSVAGDSEGKKVLLECPDAASPIVVRGATWGANIKKVPKGNATAAAAAFLNGQEGRPAVKYLVHTKYLGDPMPGKPKSFELEWRCSRKGALQSKKIDGDAVGQSFEVGC